MFNLKKLFSAPCFVCLLFSCGKKVENSSDGSGRVILPGESGTKFIDVNVDAQASRIGSAQFEAPRNAWVRVPAAPKVLEGDALIVSTRIYFNSTKKSNSQYQEFYCDYTSIKMINNPTAKDINKNYNHYFKGCFEDVDQDGEIDELNFIPGDEVALEKDKNLQIEVEVDDNANTLSIRSEIEIDYL